MTHREDSDMTDAGASSGSSMSAAQPFGQGASTRFSSTNQPTFGPGRPRHGGTLRCVCPHCGQLAKVKTTFQMTSLVKELRYQCGNFFCGHTFVATLSINRTIVQSAMPDPRVKLPIGQPRPRKPAGDDLTVLPAT